MSCRTCTLAPAYPGFDTCLACGIAYMLHESPDDIESIRRINAGDAWLADFNREVERQQCALLSCGNQVAPKAASVELIFAAVATEPAVSTYWTEVIVMAFVLAALLSWLIVMLWRAWKARRAEQQLRDERRMRLGFKSAVRRGWIRDDVQ